MEGFKIYLVVVAMIVIFAILLNQSLDEDSIARKFISRVKNRNKIYQCPNKICSRYFRQYQVDILAIKGKPYTCPHCDYCVSSDSYYGERIKKAIKKPDKWMDSHSDCFRINLKQYLMIQNTAKKVRKLREEEEAIQRFEDYNKLSTDMSWIEKIQKVNK